jgi:hypothetical protein
MTTTKRPGWVNPDRPDWYRHIDLNVMALIFERTAVMTRELIKAVEARRAGAEPKKVTAFDPMFYLSDLQWIAYKASWSIAPAASASHESENPRAITSPPWSRRRHPLFRRS